MNGRPPQLEMKLQSKMACKPWAHAEGPTISMIRIAWHMSRYLFKSRSYVLQLGICKEAEL